MRRESVLGWRIILVAALCSAMLSAIAQDSDGDGVTDAEEISVGRNPNVHEPMVVSIIQAMLRNEPPEFTSAPLLTAHVGTNYTYTPTANDPDGNTVTLTLDTPPAGMVLNQGVVTWTPSVSGVSTVRVFATDSRGASTLQEFDIDVGHEPTFSTAGPTSGVVGELYVYGPLAIDLDGDPITFAVLPPAPAGLEMADPVSGLITWLPDQTGEHTISLEVSDGTGGTDTQTITVNVAGPINTPPVLSIGNQSVNLGETMTLDLSSLASDPDPGGVLAFSATSLPPGATLSATGEFVYRPAQSGTIQITFIASDGALMTTETIDVTTVVPPGGLTTLKGRVTDAGDTLTPVVGVIVTVVGVTGQQAITDANGDFAFSDLPVAGKIVLDLDSSSTQPLYADFREAIEIIAGVPNVIARDIYLPIVDQQSATTVVAGTPTTVNNTNAQITLTADADTVMDGATPFTGSLSVTTINPDNAPVQLPQNVGLDTLITIQPLGVEFSTPAQITFPNTENLPNGAVFNIYSVDPISGLFVIVGQGKANGSVVETTAGGIRAAGWHGFVPRPLRSPGLADRGSPGGRSNSAGSGYRVCTGSETTVASGGLVVQHDLAPYTSLGVSRNLSLVYDSLRADPRPIIPVNPIVTPDTPVPGDVESSLVVGGITQMASLTTDTSGLNSQGDELRQALQFDARAFNTSVQPMSFVVTSKFNAVSAQMFVEDQVLIRNDIASPFGAGWTLAGLQRMHASSPLQAVIADGTGMTHVFARSYEFEGTLHEADLNSSRSTYDFAAGDIDGDGTLVFVAVEDNGSANGTGPVWLSRFDGTNHHISEEFDLNDYPGVSDFATVRDLVSADFNGDGYADVAASFSGGILIQLNDGLGHSPTGNPTVLDGASFLFDGFVPPAAPNSPPLSMVVADVDRDGKLDIVFHTGSLIHVALGIGDGTFVAGQVVADFTSSSGAAAELAVSDVNSDDNPDVIVHVSDSGGFNNRVAIALGDGTGTFVHQPSADIVLPQTNESGANQHAELAMGDFNGDGAPDIAARARLDNSSFDAIFVLFNDGRGGYSAPPFSFPVGLLNGGDIAAFDLNNDGRDDIISSDDQGGVGSGQSNFEVRLSSGSGAFELATAWNNPGIVFHFAQSFLFGDFDGDGDTDIGGLHAGGIFVAPLAMDDTYLSPDGDYSELIAEQGGTYTRRYPDGRVVAFDVNGRQTATTDRNGRITAYLYDAEDRLQQITDPASRVTMLAYEGANIDTVTDPSGRVTRFFHDSYGNLRVIQDPDGARREFEYDAQHRMVTNRSKRGFDTTYEYDPVNHRHVDTVRPDGGAPTLTPSDAMGLPSSQPGAPTGTPSSPLTLVRPDGSVSAFTDGAGRETAYTVEGFGFLTSELRSFGATEPSLTTTVERDSNGNPELVLDPSRYEQRFTYDEAGNVVTASAPTLAALAAATESTIHFEYDNFALETKQTFTDGGSVLRILHTDRDANGNVTKVTTPESRVTMDDTEYLGPGTALTQFRDRFGTLTTLDYFPIDTLAGSSGNLKMMTVGSGLTSPRETEFTYTPEGYVKTITDAEDRTFTFDYDELGRPITLTMPQPDNRVFSVSYDAAGNVESVKPPGKPDHTFTFTEGELIDLQIPPILPGLAETTDTDYNGERQVELVKRPFVIGQTQEVIDPMYDDGGRLKQIATPTGDYVFAYEPTRGTLETITAPAGGGTIAYGYSDGIRTSATWAGTVAGAVVQLPDAQGRLRSQQVNARPAIIFDYDDDGLLTQAGSLSLTRTLSPPDGETDHGLVRQDNVNGVISEYGYNPFGELRTHTVSKDGITHYDVSYQRDELGRITLKTETIGGTTEVTRYTYDQRQTDALDTVETGPDISSLLVTESYFYDSNGNRDSGSFNSVDSSIVTLYDDQDRLLQYNDLSFTYTANGELQTKTDMSAGETTTYQYDVFGNLRSVQLPNGGSLIEYIVDGRNRRIGKKVDGVLVQGFLYRDQLNPVAELNPDGSVKSEFIYSDKPNVPTYIVQGGHIYRIVSDHTGSVRLVINTTTNQVMQRLNYDSFGNVLSSTGSEIQPFGFAGGLYDATTGLLRFGSRDYSPREGRWTTKDPIGFSGKQPNLFAYLGNDPVNWTDETGQGKSARTTNTGRGTAGNPRPMGHNLFGTQAGTWHRGRFYQSLGTPIELHHNVPIFLFPNAARSQILTPMYRPQHTQLHRDLNLHLMQYVRRNGTSMRPSPTNSGRTIRWAFTSREREQALRDFYSGPGHRYFSAARDFYINVGLCR